MGIETKQVQIAKETDDILMLLIKIAGDAKAGMPALEIAAGSLQEFIKAVDGSQDIDDEIKEDVEAVLETVGRGLGKLAAIFLIPKPKSEPKDDGGDVV